MSPRRRTSRSIRKTTNGPRDRAWRAMRAARGGHFTIPEILAVAEIHPISLAKMLGALRRTGFVKKVKKHNPHVNEAGTYLLLRNSGPFRPWAQTDGVVYDRNTGMEHRPTEELDEEACDGN